MANVASKFGFGGTGLVLPGYPSSSFATGKYIMPALNRMVFNTTGATDFTNTLIFLPFIVKRATTITAVSFRNAGAADAGDKIRCGVYSSSGGLPSTLLAEGAEVTIGGAAATNDVDITDQNLTPNTLYFGAIVANADVQVLGITSCDPVIETPTITLALTTEDTWVYYQSHTYGALPASATITAYGRSGSPALFLKVA